MILRTKPSEDWLIGFEHIPEVQIPTTEWEGSITSIGIFFYRIDFFKNKNKEQDG